MNGCAAFRQQAIDFTAEIARIRQAGGPPLQMFLKQYGAVLEGGGAVSPTRSRYAFLRASPKVSPYEPPPAWSAWPGALLTGT